MKYLVYIFLFCALIYLSETRTGGLYYDDALKAALILDVNVVYNQTSEEYKKLVAKGKIPLVNDLEKLVQFVKEIDGKIQKITVPKPGLSVVILDLVKNLIKEGKRIFDELLITAQASFYDTSVNSIITIVSKTYDDARTAYEALVKLSVDKKNTTILAEGLLDTIKLVQDIDKNFKSVSPTTYVGRVMQNGVEKIIRQIETVLEMDYKAVTHKSFIAHNYKTW